MDGLGDSTSTKPSVVSLRATESSMSIGESKRVNTTGLMGDKAFGLSNTISSVDIPGELMTRESVGRRVAVDDGASSRVASVCTGGQGTGSGRNDVDVVDEHELPRDSGRRGGGVGRGRGLGEAFGGSGGAAEVGMRGSGRETLIGCC